MSLQGNPVSLGRVPPANILYPSTLPIHVDDAVLCSPIEFPHARDLANSVIFYSVSPKRDEIKSPYVESWRYVVLY